jgi:hypothetical protein
LTLGNQQGEQPRICQWPSPSDIYMTIDSETVGPAAVILLAARGADDPHHAGTIALLRTGALAALDLALYEITTSPISDAGTPARRCLYTSAPVRSDHGFAVVR